LLQVRDEVLVYAPLVPAAAPEGAENGHYSHHLFIHEQRIFVGQLKYIVFPAVY
jgi:hypothetical protein